MGPINTLDSASSNARLELLNLFLENLHLLKEYSHPVPLLKPHMSLCLWWHKAGSNFVGRKEESGENN